MEERGSVFHCFCPSLKLLLGTPAWQINGVCALSCSLWLWGLPSMGRPHALCG